MTTNDPIAPLAGTLLALTPAPRHPALLHLTEALRQRYGSCVTAILFYGSCLRSGDPFDGLVDLYLIVDNYRSANSSAFSASNELTSGSGTMKLRRPYPTLCSTPPFSWP